MEAEMISKATIKFCSKFQIQILSYSFTRDHSFLLTPPSSPLKEDLYPRASRHIDNSLNVYLFLDFEF